MLEKNHLDAIVQEISLKVYNNLNFDLGNQIKLEDACRFVVLVIDEVLKRSLKERNKL